jgi:integrating conjugative element protein (TIGR03765 family)
VFGADCESATVWTQPGQHTSHEPSIRVPTTLRRSTYDEADMLPVFSRWLSPGKVLSRVIRMPGLPPLFLIGDDPRSRAWLEQRRGRLQQLHAVGLVVNVSTPAALAQLRQTAKGLVLAPVAADELAQRLVLHHYPVLITADRIEQ